MSTISPKRLDYESIMKYELVVRVTDSQPNPRDPSINYNYCLPNVRPLTCSLWADITAASKKDLIGNFLLLHNLEK